MRPVQSNQFPIRRNKPSTVGTLYYVTPTGEKPVPGAVGLPYWRLARIKADLAAKGVHNVTTHRHD